jgi:hypothetical protein
MSKSTQVEVLVSQAIVFHHNKNEQIFHNEGPKLIEIVNMLPACISTGFPAKNCETSDWAV